MVGQMEGADEGVGHLHSFGFHVMFFSEFEVGDVFVVEVNGFTHIVMFLDFILIFMF